MLLNWERYVEMRWKAQRNIAQILRYQRLDPGPDFDPPDMATFRKVWGEHLDLGSRTGIFRKDAEPTTIQGPDGLILRIHFVASDLAKSKIPKKTIASVLLDFLKDTTGWTAEQVFGSNQIELIKNRQCILISYGHLEGGAKNEITKFNQLFELPIRHFTIDELQSDKTVHAMGPKSMEVLSAADVEAWISRQRGLMIGRTRLANNYDAIMEDLGDDEYATVTIGGKEVDKFDYKAMTNEEILDKMQTINTSDPWVKWRSYKVGDVLKITRRIGHPKIAYRRVVLVEPMATKPPKVNKTTTNL